VALHHDNGKKQAGVYDDNRPFTQMAKDVSETIEKKRQEINRHRKEKYIGTFRGLEEAIMRRKMEATNAK
jgi:hypothetical protein